MRWSENTLRLIDSAIAEDLGSAGDITAALLGESETEVLARVVPREAGVVCGLALLPVICRHFSKLGPTIVSSPGNEEAGANDDGKTLAAGKTAATIAGPRAAVLSAERTILNFLGRMSGVATLTRRYVDLVRSASPTCQVLDTRKTLPGWRELDKYAVRSGGGANHRKGLFDAILIKDNHLAGLPIAKLATQLREWIARRNEAARFVEVEVDNLDQFREVCKVEGVDIVLLDNFATESLAEAVRRRDEAGLRGKLQLEASGGITLETIAEIAATGVDRISVGALTHSAAALDLGLDFE